MKSEPIRNLLTTDRGCTGYISLSGQPQSPNRKRLKLTRRQQRDAAADWTYFGAELFAHLAEHAPELLFGPWRLLHELVRANDRYWFYPPITVGDSEDGRAPEPLGYLDRDALHEDWQSLQQRVWLAS